MTADQKKSLAVFLDVTAASLQGGWHPPPSNYDFRDDTAEPAVRTAVPAAPAYSPAADSLERVAADVKACGACELCKTRTNAVPGEGAEKPLVMVIGEGPGADEDAAGRPFVGRAGQLLDRMLDSRGRLGLSRARNCYIANVLKCRPPNNRDPLPAEAEACAPFLTRQIALLRPKIILCAGKVAANHLLGGEYPRAIRDLRGRFHDIGGIPMIATYHPSALLRNEDLKAPAWDDLRLLRSRLCEIDPVYASSIPKGS
jgi:DNA polymerase